jgi:hypothetical protein
MSIEWFFPGGKRPRREADYSPPFNAEIKNARSYTSPSSYVFIDKFTFVSWSYGKTWKSFISCDIMPCSPLKVNRPFGWICCLHLQGRRISQIINERGAGSKQAFLRNVGCLSTDSTALYPTRQVIVNTAARTSNPTFYNLIENVHSLWEDLFKF